MPSFPFHGWMPDGYMQMPIAPLAVFTAILSKVAAYGFLQIALPLFPHAAVKYQELLLLVALASILYGSAMAFTTTQARLVLGYSSVAQLGFIVLGIFALDERGADGALLQSVNHAIVAAPLIFVVALLAARAGGSEDLRDMGGIATKAPAFAAVFLVLTFALLAMPGTSNFVGEFMILLGVFHGEDGDRDHRLGRRRAGRGLRAAALHPLDAQPRRAARAGARADPARRARARPDAARRRSRSRSTRSSR